jgi:hypothetical protein
MSTPMVQQADDGVAGDEVKADVEWAFGEEVREMTGGLTLYFVFGMDQAREGTEELSDGKDSVADVVVERTLVELAGEEVVAAGIEGFFAVAASWEGWLVEEGQAQFAAKQEPVGVRVETVIREAAGQGVQGNARSGGQEGGEDVLGADGEGYHGS